MTNAKGASYFYAIFSITLVLFVLGVAGFLGIEAKRVSTGFKENLTVEVILKDDVNSSRISPLETLLQGKPFVKKVKYISKEAAVELLKKNSDVEKNFLDILGYNPLYASFNLNLFEQYTTGDSVETIRNDLSRIPEVKQINFQSNILESLDKKVKSASFLILVIASVFLIFAVSLIFNTIRLAMFSNRFTIKTQQLFGATRWFIIKPFLGRSFVNGLISGIAACLLIAALIWYFNYFLPELDLQEDMVTFGVLFGAIILFGILISFVSTLTAVFHYLRLKLEELY